MVRSLVSSVSDASGGLNVTWDQLVSKGVTMAVGVAVSVTDAVSVAERAAERGVLVAHVRGDLGQSERSKN
jgi:ABC-type sugar transport system substrate-binding protein